jgi:5'-nucleotidase/UDP-sugar diphosphatase
MKNTHPILLSLLILFSFSACVTTQAKQNTDGKIHVTILHFNDVYEITPVSGGNEGGLARVATLRKQLLTQNANTITTLGGDLFSPSAIGTATYQGDQLAGKQMVEVLNQLKLDYATFGNHEFDLKEKQFYKRMDEAKFTWISSNVFDANHQPYAGVKKNLVIPFKDEKSGKTFRVGIFGLTLDVNKPAYVSYTDPKKTAGEQLKQLAEKSDFQIALTHQSRSDDEVLLQTYPQIDLLLGGHEHINYQRWRGNFTPLLKGDANVRSVYIVDLYFDPTTGKTEIKPTFVPINNSLAEDPTVKATADKWVKIAFDAFRAEGLNPEETVTTTTKPLDGLEVNVRNGQTNLTQLLAKALLLPYPTAELSLYNSGAIRIDDTLPAGKITVYDIIRVLPFSDHIQLAEFTGELLKKVLNQGEASIDTGGYLQSTNTELKEGQWFINDMPINESKRYKVAINTFLTSGRESHLRYLTPNNPGLTILNQGAKFDIRKQLIRQLKEN